MAKKKQAAGLPDDFDIEIDDRALERVADIEDFIDATMPEKKPQPKAAPKKLDKPEKSSPRSRPDRAAGSPEPVSASKASKSPSKAPLTAKVGKKKKSKRPARKELTLDPESLRMLDDLVDDVRAHTPEANARATEIARAIIHAAHEAKRHASYAHVNRRGQWGSSTARAFVTDLKEAFIVAVAELHKEQYER